jgi:hypothetical protein
MDPKAVLLDAITCRTCLATRDLIWVGHSLGFVAAGSLDRGRHERVSVNRSLNLSTVALIVRQSVSCFSLSVRQKCGVRNRFACVPR